MCGIVYAYDFLGRSVNDTVIDQFKDQRSRGTNGFGFFLPQNNKLCHNTREGRILSHLKRTATEEVLFHHRMPTSTENVRNACHPFSTKKYFGDKCYVLVHNGMINNTWQLREKHKKYGIEYVSKQQENEKFNDSEALLWDIAIYLEGWEKQIDAAGSIAFVMVQLDKDNRPEKLFFGRNNGNPLHMRFSKTKMVLSSQGPGADIDENQLYEFTYGSFELNKRPTIFPRTISYSGGNPHAGDWKSSPNYRPNPHSDDLHLEATSSNERVARSIKEIIESSDDEENELNLTFVDKLEPVTIYQKSDARTTFYSGLTSQEMIDQKIKELCIETKGDIESAKNRCGSLMVQYGLEIMDIQEALEKAGAVTEADFKLHQIASLEYDLMEEASEQLEAMSPSSFLTLTGQPLLSAGLGD